MRGLPRLPEDVYKRQLDADAALISCEEGSDAALRADLERLGQTTRRTMKVLREEMLSLRTPLERTEDVYKRQR